jgi:hypothetical protein
VPDNPKLYFGLPSGDGKSTAMPDVCRGMDDEAAEAFDISVNLEHDELL